MSRAAFSWAKRVKGISRRQKRGLVALAELHPDGEKEFDPGPASLYAAAGLGSLAFGKVAQELEKGGLISRSLRFVNGARRFWYRLNLDRKAATGSQLRRHGPNQADLFDGQT